MAPLNLSAFCADLRTSTVWRICRSRRGVTVAVTEIASLTRNLGIRALAWPLPIASAASTLGKGRRGFMKTLVSLALGAAMLFGAATLGLHSGSAGARTRHDKN